MGAGQKSLSECRRRWIDKGGYKMEKYKYLGDEYLDTEYEKIHGSSVTACGLTCMTLALIGCYWFISLV